MSPTITENVNLPKNGDSVGSAIRVVKIPVLSRLYVWSVVFEPLLFFVMFDQAAFGVGANVSRILQLIVVIGLVLKFLLSAKTSDIMVPNYASPLYAYYSRYVSLVIFAGVVGVLSGAYSMTRPYDLVQSGSAFAKFLNSAELRPVFEYVITLYYFVYFTILPQYIVKTDKSVEYFFSVFKTVFIISFVVGVIDLGFASLGSYLVPRQIADWRGVGARFHGLAGEPRDAFVYLFMGLAMLYLHAYFRGQRLNKWWGFAIVTAALFTQAASGLLGIVFFLGLLSLYGIYSLGRLGIWRVVQLTTVFTLSITLLYVAASNSKRIMDYLESTSDLWSILEASKELPHQISLQYSNIYPLYDLTVKFRSLNILPILVGSGLGSASVINNFYNPAWSETNNPHMQFVRIIFESGIIGTYFFIMSFAYPVKYLTKHIPKNRQFAFILLMLLLLGCVLGHRSSASFIYLGVFIATFRVLGHRSSHSNGVAQ